MQWEVVIGLETHVQLSTASKIFSGASCAFGAEPKRRILIGTYVLSHGYYDAYYIKAQKVRRLIAREFDQAFEKVDAILSPVTVSTAYDFGAKSDPVAAYLGDLYTVPASLAGLPCMSMPCGIHSNARPIGVQLT